MLLIRNIAEKDFYKDSWFLPIIGPFTPSSKEYKSKPENAMKTSAIKYWSGIKENTHALAQTISDSFAMKNEPQLIKPIFLGGRRRRVEHGINFDFFSYEIFKAQWSGT